MEEINGRIFVKILGKRSLAPRVDSKSKTSSKIPQFKARPIKGGKLHVPLRPVVIRVSLEQLIYPYNSAYGLLPLTPFLI